LTYHISYDMGELDVRILENNISYYQYSKETILPNASQVSVPEGYQFAGWYYGDDIEKKPVTVISATEYGDKVLKPLLVKKAEQDGDKDKDDKDKDSDKDNDNKRPGQEEDDKKQDNIPSDEDNNKKPGDAVLDTDKKPGTDKNPDNSIINKVDKDNFNNKQQSQKKEKLTKGSVFWKGNLKYKVVSIAAGKESVKVVGNRFQGKKLSIPAKVTYGKKTFLVTGIGQKAFYKAGNITTVIVSGNIKAIEKMAFANMKRLRSATIGKGVKKIAKSAFQKNSKLKKVVIKSKKLSKVEKKAFAQIHPKAKIKVVKSKKKALKKVLKASGLKKTVKVC
ncbi:MAG TPA: hypothetical protein DDY31_12080, partial [Lachnospiraceae bacterium]|nr:hypothetical protein [Lachnospiraceae bacterium]